MAVRSADLHDLTIEQRLDLVPALAGHDRVVEPLPGGLTNTNLKVTVDGHHYVARLSSPSATLLAIDRTAEHLNSVAAAASGIAPAVVDFVPAARVLLIEWIEGRTLQAADLRQDSLLPAVAAACRQLHAGPRFCVDFDMFAVQRRYLDTAAQRGFRLPDRYTEFMPALDEIRTVLQLRPPITVPCNNDLLAANFIDDGERLWLLDYEYSGNNDPCFELGNIWSESNLTEAQLDMLVMSYFGRHSAAATARARLQGLVSQYGWTLWGVIQNAVSEIDFDFWSWAMEKYERAVATFDSSELAVLLTAVADGDPPSSVVDRTAPPTHTSPRQEGDQP
jgi:thiamine kinase-like enzyme